MSTKIRKRSGHQVPFEMTKIFDAVDKAFNAAGKKTPATFKSILSQNSNKFQSLGTVERIQDELENLLLSCGHVDVYKKFSTYRGQRAIMREMKQSEVFKSIVNLEDNDITNDNANMSAVSPAGMMYKFGAESTKAFAKRYVLDPLITKELEDGYIHIHDLDHAAFGDFNCVSENAYITIKDETGAVMNTTLSFFNKFFTDDSQQVIELPQNYWIKGRNDWTLINKISRRRVGADDVLYKIRCNKGVGLDVTENHLIPVIRDNKEVLLRVKDLKVGDSLLKPASFDLNLINQDYIDIVAELRRLDIIDGIYIYNVKQLNNYLRYKYDKGLWQLLDRRSNHLRYIKLEEYIKIIDNYDIPYEVIQTMQVAVMNGKTKLPLYLPITNELAEVIGYLHSEGSVSFVSDATTHKRSYAVSFCNKDERIVNKYKLAWKKSIGSRLGDYINKQGCHIITASSRLLCLLFSKILGGKNHAYNISVPDFIFNASDDIKWHYISALIDGDGCISNSCKTIRYTTICEKFAEQLVMLLNSVGIESSINTSFIEGRTVYFGDCKSRSHGDMHNVVVSHRQYVEKMLESLCGIKQRSVDVMYASDQISAVTCEPNKIRSIVQSSDTPYVFDLETVEHWFIVNNIVVHNCIQSPMDKILKDGFSAHHGAIRGAKRIETAAFLMMISLETSQNEMFGGQGIPAFDFYLAPFVRLAYEQEIDKLAEVMGWSEDIIEKYKSHPITEYAEQYDDKYINIAMKRVVDRVHQSMESFVHNANSIHSRGGNQTVFSSINYGTDTSPEGRCIIREILRACMEGVGNGATAIFPIHIFKCKEGVNKNPGDPNYDLYKMSWPVTARRFFPNYINLDASFYKNDWWKADDPNRYIYEPATMGCRTSVFKDRFLDYPTTIGRGNLSFTTINLPMLALDAAIETGYYAKTKDGFECVGGGDLEDRKALFFKKLDKYCDITAKQLHDRYEMQAKTKALQYPLVMSRLYIGSENLKRNSEVREAIKHGTLSIGFVGLAEALIALTGKHHGESEVAQEIGLHIVEFIYKKCQAYSEQYDLNYSCFATPAESVAGKMEHITAARYGKIKDITDHGYFTNSNHVPVWYHCTPKHKAEIEGPYHKFTTAGHIFYVEADADLTKNPEAVDAVNRMAWANDVGYNAINHVSARCPRCSYEVHDGSDAPDHCPKCGEKMDKLARITGYLSSTVTKWNSGKIAEFKDRVIHE